MEYARSNDNEMRPERQATLLQHAATARKTGFGMARWLLRFKIYQATAHSVEKGFHLPTPFSHKQLLKSCSQLQAVSLGARASSLAASSGNDRGPSAE